MEIVVRQAFGNDLPDILKLYGQPDMDNGKVFDIEEAKSIFRKICGHPDYKVFVAEFEREIVGTFALAILDNLANMGAKSGLIEDVVVRTDMQGKGVGKKMMASAIDICKSKNCYKVALSSNIKRERAHRFYEGLGFKRHGYSFYMELEAP
jgi:GNAT superfamily N-acetyltransferase